MKWIYLEREKELINCEDVVSITFSDPKRNIIVFMFANRSDISYEVKNEGTQTPLTRILGFLESHYEHTLKL